MAYGLWLVAILILFYCDLSAYGGVVGGTGLRGFVWFRLPNADDLIVNGVKFALIFSSVCRLKKLHNFICFNICEISA
jgi:hypothetical protein